MKNPIEPCPICGATERRLLFQQRFSGLSSGSFLHGYDVVVCADCGLGFADGLPPAESFDRYYAEMSKWDYLETGGVESEQHARRFETTAAMLTDLDLEKDAPVLDVGCSTGGMLAALQKKGFTKLLGLDPSPGCARLARRNYGIDVFTGPVTALDQLPTDFGLVLLAGVLEHFREPNAALQDIRRRLAEGGLFYVVVPDASRFAEYFDAPYQHFSVEHILFFSPESLINLLRKNGFEPVKVMLSAYPYTRQSSHPVVEALFRKGEPTPWVRDQSTEPALQRYIDTSVAMDEKIADQLATLAVTQEPVFVWGVGTSTQRLMSSSRLREANIIAFVDSNPHYHGKQLEGRPIISPVELAKRSEPLVIGSVIFRQEIVQQIKEDLKLSNRILALGAD